MLNNLYKFTIIIIFTTFLVQSLYSEKDVAVEVQGMSIISSNSLNAREKAFADAFQKAVFKVCKDFLQIDNKTQIQQIITEPENYINGYEIIEENQVGNILNEKLKVFINLNALLKKFKKSNSENPVYVLSICKKDNNSIDSLCSKQFKNKLSLIPNIIQVYSDNITNIQSLIVEPKDLLIIINYKIISFQKIYSIGKTFSDLVFNIDIYNAKGILIKEFQKKIRLLYNSEKSPSEFLPQNFYNDIIDYITLKVEEISKLKSKKASKDIFYFIVENPKHYNIIRQITNLMESYNIKFNIEQISNKKIYFQINGIDKEEFIKILKFSKIKFEKIVLDQDIYIYF